MAKLKVSVFLSMEYAMYIEMNKNKKKPLSLFYEWVKMVNVRGRMGNKKCLVQTKSVDKCFHRYFLFVQTITIVSQFKSYMKTQIEGFMFLL